MNDWLLCFFCFFFKYNFEKNCVDSLSVSLIQSKLNLITGYDAERKQDQV